VNDSIENSAAHLHATTGALRTGSAMLDRSTGGIGAVDARLSPDSRYLYVDQSRIAPSAHLRSTVASSPG
jgi:hypothetical protein